MRELEYKVTLPYLLKNSCAEGTYRESIDRSHQKLKIEPQRTDIVVNPRVVVSRENEIHWAVPTNIYNSCLFRQVGARYFFCNVQELESTLLPPRPSRMSLLSSISFAHVFHL